MWVKEMFKRRPDQCQQKCACLWPSWPWRAADDVRAGLISACFTFTHAHGSSLSFTTLRHRHYSFRAYYRSARLSANSVRRYLIPSSSPLPPTIRFLPVQRSSAYDLYFLPACPLACPCPSARSFAQRHTLLLFSQSSSTKWPPLLRSPRRESSSPTVSSRPSWASSCEYHVVDGRRVVEDRDRWWRDVDRGGERLGEWLNGFEAWAGWTDGRSAGNGRRWC